MLKQKEKEILNVKVRSAHKRERLGLRCNFAKKKHYISVSSPVTSRCKTRCRDNLSCCHCAAATLLALSGIRTHDLCDVGAVLSQLSYQSHMRAVVCGLAQRPLRAWIFSGLCSSSVAAALALMAVITQLLLMDKVNFTLYYTWVRIPFRAWIFFQVSVSVVLQPRLH